MAEKTNAGVKGNIFNNRNALIVAVIVFVLLLTLIPILITQLAGNGNGSTDTPDTGKILSGTYSLDIANAGSSRYVFDGNKVTNVYNGITVEYTYVIAVENGAEVIKLTTTDQNGAQKTTTHEFYEGKMGDKAFISINDSYYYLQESAE